MNSLVTANLSCLRQGIAFLESLPAGIYSQSCGDVFNSTIGGHMRHNLDHYLAFVDGLEAGRIDYDARERERELETSPLAAVSVIRQLIAGLKPLGDADLDRKIQVRMDDGGDASWSETSLRRELQFLLSHSIHHYALIVSIASRYGLSEFPENFGIAPSTLHHHARQGA